MVPGKTRATRETRPARHASHVVGITCIRAGEAGARVSGVRPWDLLSARGQRRGGYSASRRTKPSSEIVYARSSGR